MMRIALRQHGWYFAGAFAPFLILAAWHWNWSPASSSGDYAQYLLHARALVEGRSYTDIGYLYHPEAADIGPWAYPPGLPLLLAPIVWLGGVHSPWVHVASAGCLLLFGALAYARLQRSLPRPVAALGVALALLGIESSLGSLVPMSDLPFCAALWLLLLAADAPGKWGLGRMAAITVLGLGLIGIRLAGVAVVPALGLYWLLQRRQLGIRPLIPVLVWVGVGIAGLAAGLVANPYANVVHAEGFDLAARFTGLIRNYRYALLDAQLYPFPGDRANDLYHLLATPVIVLGAVVVVRRLGMSLVICVAVAYSVLLVAVRVGEARYLWPLLPLLGASCVSGVAAMASWLSSRRGITALGDSVPRAAILVPSLLLLLALVRQLSVPPPFAVTGTDDARALHAWLATEHRRGPVHAMFHNPRVLTLESGVPAMGIVPRTAPGVLSAMDERRIDLLVWQRPDVSTCLQRIANTLPTSFPQRFELAYANPTFRVYRVLPGAAVLGPGERIDWRRADRYCPPV